MPLRRSIATASLTTSKRAVTAKGRGQERKEDKGAVTC